MRIDKLYIKEFKNLREFFIDFDESTLTTVLIGYLIKNLGAGYTEATE